MLAEIEAASSVAELERLRVAYLGRNGQVTKQLREIGQLPPTQRASAGAKANQVRQKLETALTEAKKKLQHKHISAQIETLDLDVTAPVKLPVGYGAAHPVMTVIDELVRLFWQMGYQVVDGPEIETEWYNFEALLVPADHPARDSRDTFYLVDGNLPRTETSNVQIRYMEQHQPPVRIISPGKVYRNENEDQRHSWQFHQVEGLVVDRGVTMADLKGTLMAMMRGILGEATQVRLLPNYFPFTEPSVEMHATCPSCGGKGCAMCSQTGWLELGGAGMVHPGVLRNVNIDPETYTGFAFGFGPERIAAIKHNIADIRGFWRPDLKFLEQLS